MKRCKWCGIAKTMRRRQMICDDCKGNQFFKTKHWIWLESQAIKYGVQCWPDDTEGMEALLELRQMQTRCKGVSRRSGFVWAKYNYELAHRYPASKGGQLIPDNLVLMPSKWNKTMSNRHGHGLDCFRVDLVNKLPRAKLKQEFKRRYDLLTLERFVTKTKDNGADFDNEGVDVVSVLTSECKRLGINVDINDDMEIEEKIMEVLSRYEEICGNDGDLIGMLNNEVAVAPNEILEVDKGWWVQSFEPEDVALLSDADFKEAMAWKHKLRPRNTKEQKVYMALILDARNTSEAIERQRRELASHWAEWEENGYGMPF